MDRRRAAGLLLALAACIATATAAPTASNHTALDLYDAAPDGCYYNFQHYGEGDRIMTNEPCLNCTCHNRMLMCYLRVCPFTKPIGQDCTIEKRADQCCPIVTCPDVPVDLLTSTTTSPAEYGPTGVGKLDRYGCSLNGKYFPEGSKVPPTPNKPCEHCYCIRNMTTCVMQECTLHVDGCTPIYHKDVCCPVRYSCDHPEDEMPLLDDLSTTVRPTPGFLLTTTTISPVTQISQDCVYDNRVFPDGALIKMEKACDHCYCMKGDIVCVVQECGTPMENEGKNCTALPPRDGVCCPDTYICEGDESSTGSYESTDFTTHTARDEVTTLSPPRRTISEGSGYRNEPDEVPYTKLPILPDIEGSGEEEEPKQPIEVLPGSTTLGTTEDILANTEETHEYIPLTTTKPLEKEITTTKVDEKVVSSDDMEKSSKPQTLATTTSVYSINKDEDSITDQAEDIGSGEIPGDISHTAYGEVSVTPSLLENTVTTEINKESEVTPVERESPEPELPSKSITTEKDIKIESDGQDRVTDDVVETSTSKLLAEHAFTNAPISEESTKGFELTEQSYVPKETTTKTSEVHILETTSMPFIEDELKETTELAQQTAVTSVPDEYPVKSEEHQHHPQSTSVPDLEDEFVTTESQEHELATEGIKEPGYFEPQQHVTASTPMLEEIENDTMEFTKPVHSVPSTATQGDTYNILSTTIANVPSLEDDEKEVSKSTITDEHIPDGYISGTTSIPVYDQQVITSEEPHKVPDVTDVDKSLDSSSISTPLVEESGRRTTKPDFTITASQDDSDVINLSSTTTSTESEGVTTEPDKGLNTIPSDSIEEAPEVHKSTSAEDNITTESDLDLLTIVSKQTTVPYTSVSREESSTLTTESAFRKEDYSSTESHQKETTVTAGITEEVIPTLALDQTKSTDIDLQEIATTTTKPKYTEKIEETTLAKEGANAPSYESSTPEISVSEYESMTSAPTQEKLPETTTVNQEDNEILNEPRIPGEGNCLFNGETYTNESAVPRSHKCQSGCKCVSSIITCDPIICSPAPEYMNNCETVYDSPDACCPTYICDHKTETSPPQSHSQMSGTETPVISSEPCHGDECKKEDKKHSEKPSDACISGVCIGSSDESKVPSDYPPVENIPPVTDQKEECVGDSCTPIICTNENGCQATPVKPCEGDKCEVIPDTIISQQPQQQCADGESCTVSNIPSEDCSSGNCDTTHVQLEDTHPKETCTEKEGCPIIPTSPEKECKDENCKKIDSSSLDQPMPEQCSEPGCEKKADKKEEAESATNKEPEKVTETTEKLETITEPSKEVHSYQTSTESHEIATEYPDIVTDEYLTTLSDNIDHKTQFESQTETSTKSTEFISQEATSSKYDPEKTKQETDEEQDQLLPVSTDSTVKEDEIKITSSQEIITEEPNLFVTPQDDITASETEQPQEIVTKEDTVHETTDQADTSTKISEISETQHVTESVQKLDDGNTTPEESSTETPKTYTPESPPQKSEQQESSTTLAQVEESTDLPDIVTHVDSSLESSSEPTLTYATELVDEDIQKKVVDESITEPPKTLDDIKHDEINEVKPVSTTTDDQTEKIDQAEVVTRPSLDSGIVTSTLGLMDQDITTITSTEAISSGPTETLSIESQPPKEKYTPSVTAEETVTDSSKTHTIQSLDTTISSITKSPQEVTQKDFTETDVGEVVTVPIKSSSTEAQEFTESPEKVKHEDTTIMISEDSSTETAQIFVTEPKSPGEVYHDDTTPLMIEESSTESPKPYPTDESKITTSPEGVDYKVTTDISGDYTTKPQKVSITDKQEVTEKVDQKDTTSKISEESDTEPPKTYITEIPEVTKYDNENGNEITTVNILREIVTEPPKTFETKPQETPQPSEDQEDTTSKISHSDAPVSPIEYVTEAEETQSTHTTIKSVYDVTTEPSNTSEEIDKQVDFTSTAQYITESNIEVEVTKSPTVEIPKKEADIDEKKPSVQLEVSQDVTSPQEFTTSETTPLFTSDSKVVTSEEEKPVKTTGDTFDDNTAQPPKADVDGITDSSVKYQASTSSTVTEHEDYDISIAVTPVTSSFEQKPDESTPKQPESQKPDMESETLSSSTAGLEEVALPEATSTQQPEKSITTEKSLEIDTEVQVSTYIPADEIKTTSSKVEDFTTSKPVEASQLPQGMEITTGHPDISHTFQEETYTEKLPQEISTEIISVETIKPVELDDKMTTEKHDTVTESMQSEPEFSPTSQTSSDKESSVLIETYTEEPVTKYSSPKSTIEFDSTKTNLDENISTTEPVFHESEPPIKPVHDLTQFLVTEKSEITTKPIDLDSETREPIQVSTEIPESDVTQSSEPDNVKEKLTTPSRKSPDITITESYDISELITSTEYGKPSVEEIRTESPVFVDETEKEITTQKPLREESQEPAVPKQNETVSSTTLEQKLTTERLDVTPLIEGVTETIEPVAFFTETQETSTTYRPSIDTQTETSFTTVSSETKVTKGQDHPLPDLEHTESEAGVTKVSDIQIHEQTEPSKIEPEVSSKAPTGTESPTSEVIDEDHYSIAVDQVTMKIPESPSKEQPELSTEPVVQDEVSSVFESTTTTTAAHEYHESTSTPSEESVFTHKIKEPSAATSVTGELTTESTRVTESSDDLHSPEVQSETQTDTLQTITPEKETPVEVYLTTRMPLEPEIYQSTLSTSEILLEHSTNLPTTSAESTTAYVLPVKEPSIPVIISDTEQTSSPEEPITVQAERITSTSEKPLQETTSSEEELILVTQKPTTIEVVEEITSLSPISDKPAKPADMPDESIVTTASEAAVTKTPETFVTVTPESSAPETSDTPVTVQFEPHVTPASEAHVTVATDSSITTASKSTNIPSSEAHTMAESATPTVIVSEASVTETSEVPIREASETPVTVASEIPVTTGPKAPITEGPETPVSEASEIPVTVTPEVPIMTASEINITDLPESPDKETSVIPVTIPSEVHTTTVSEASFTEATETPDRKTSMIPVTIAYEVPVTAASEASVTEVPETNDRETSKTPVTVVSEVPEMATSKAPDTLKEESPVTAATEASSTSASEMPVTPALETSEAPVTTAPELPKPVSTEAQPIDDVPTPDEEASFPPSSGTSAYGQEPDYGEEDQNFGPGTCRYGGKVYVSAQQIPRDDPCDFCFCFRSDIICLQQSCPPPIHGCHEEPIQGFCCPRYECPVSMATTVNVTTTTTTTTTTLPPHFPTHSYKGSAQKRGCQIKGQTYKVGEVVRASSGPCLHCTCGGDGQMKCDPKVCTPEPMLRQMIAAAVSSKRRR